MNEKQKAKVIIKTLNKIYPKAPVPLKSKNTFTLLISVLLSAQCTDVNVNNVTKDIYPKSFVTLLTLTSVHCAESSTEINNVKVFLLLRGTGALG